MTTSEESGGIPSHREMLKFDIESESIFSGTYVLEWDTIMAVNEAFEIDSCS